MSVAEPAPAVIPSLQLLTHSSEAVFKRCPRKYWLSHRLGIRPKHAADPLRFGQMWHLGADIYESGTPIDDAVDAVRNAYLDTPCPPWMSLEEYAVERETCCAMVRGHHDRYAGDAVIETVAVELSFRIPIVNPETGRPTPIYQSAGKIDRIGRLPDGRLAVIERKTAGEKLDIGSDYWKRLLMDSQISRYFLAALELGYPVETIVYDVMRKPEIRPKAIAKADRAWATSQGNYFGVKLDGACPERETPELYAARLLDDIHSRPEFYFRRMEIPRLDADLDEYRAEQWSIQRTIRACELDERHWGRAAWPRNTGSCTGFGRCAYLHICRGLKGDPAEQIPDGFEEVEDIHPELAEHKGESS